MIDKKKNDGMFCYPAVSWLEIIIGSINGKLPLYDALAIIANHFLFPDFSTRELYFFFCIALVIGVDSTPAAIPILRSHLIECKCACRNDQRNIVLPCVQLAPKTDGIGIHDIGLKGFEFLIKKSVHTKSDTDIPMHLRILFG